MAHGLSPFEIEKKGTHRNKEKRMAEKRDLFGRKTCFIWQKKVVYLAEKRFVVDEVGRFVQ